MTTLAEIEAAAEQLPAGEKGELLLFLPSKLRAERAVLPEPRTFLAELIAEWIAEDEADFRAIGRLP